MAPLVRAYSWLGAGLVGGVTGTHLSLVVLREIDVSDVALGVWPCVDVRIGRGLVSHILSSSSCGSAAWHATCLPQDSAAR